MTRDPAVSGHGRLPGRFQPIAPPAAGCRPCAACARGAAAPGVVGVAMGRPSGLLGAVCGLRPRHPHFAASLREPRIRSRASVVPLPGRCLKAGEGEPREPAVPARRLQPPAECIPAA